MPSKVKFLIVNTNINIRYYHKHCSKIRVTDGSVYDINVKLPDASVIWKADIIVMFVFSYL